MSDDFQVGDVVVCIVAAQSVPKGSHSRVIAVDWWPGGCGVEPVQVLHLAGRTPRKGYHGFSARRFRKLPPADEQFTEQMRACKPHRVGVPA